MTSESLVERLGAAHAICANDDYSKPMTRERSRQVEIREALTAGADRIKSDAAEITSLRTALAAAEAREAAKDEALREARHLMWEYGFSEDDLQPVRIALAITTTDRTALSTLLAEERMKALEEAEAAAAGKSAEFDFLAALAECRDSEHGFHSGRLHAARAIATLKQEKPDVEG